MIGEDVEFDQALQLLRETEARLLGSYEEDARNDLRLVDDACALLLLVLTNVGRRAGTLERAAETGELTGDLADLKLVAQNFIGIRTLRVIRAGRATLAFGYEREVLALDRILVELQAHRLEILADDSGKEALAWLARERTHDISKRVRKHAPDDLYANLSEDAHGDPGPVAHLHDPESGMIDLAPRRGLSTRASLIELYAGLARDQAVLIADLAGIELQGVEQLDQQIVAAQKELARDYEAAEGKQ